MTVQKWRAGALAIASLAMFSFPAVAQLAVSSNDNKPVLVNGVISVQASPGEDTVTIIDLGAPARSSKAVVRGSAGCAWQAHRECAKRDTRVPSSREGIAYPVQITGRCQ